jgi:predicted DNA-binding transcriptional regulator YafY
VRKTSGRIARLVNVFRELNVGRTITVSELAKLCRVSRRTVLADIATLREMGMNVRTDPDGEGLYWVDDATDIPVRLSRDEMLALLVACAALSQQENTSRLFASARSAVARLTGLASSNFGDSLVELSESILIKLDPEKPAQPNPDVFDRLLDAIDRRVRVRVRAQRRTGKAFTTELAPYCLAFQNGGWRVIGHSSADRVIRTLEAARISNAELLSDSFTVPPSFNAKRYLS